jgi:hypothetical protein
MSVVLAWSTGASDMVDGLKEVLEGNGAVNCEPKYVCKQLCKLN